MNNFIEKLKSRSPLIHNITNMVTINDVANIELACGARAIMAMAPQEMDEVTGICDGLNLNIGTPSEERFEAMRIAARMAAKKKIPIVLDLVGVGVSRFRMDFVMSLLDEVHVDVIKGNLSEVKAVMEHGRCDGGVEVTDTADESDAKALACRAALRYGCICVITGETDYVAELCDEADCYDNNESFYNVATKEEEYADLAHPSAKYHEKSHGESFLALAQNNLHPNGLYLFDEPEAALSPQRQLTLLMQIYSCAKEGAQFIIVTHSPILLGIPDADIYCFDNGRIHLCEYEDTESYQVTEMFINNRQMLLDRLLTD